MARPTDAGGFAEALYEQMQPLAYDDERLDWPLLVFLGAVGQTIEDLDALAHTDTPWLNMINLDAIPDEALEWLAQFVGVVLDSTLSHDDQRQQIRLHIGWGRGTRDTFISQARTKLTGTQTVLVDERTPTPYSFTVTTYGDETPLEDWPITNLIANPSFETNTNGWFVE